jgi:hypothetical protein
MPTFLSQMVLRQNLSRILTNTEMDNNLSILATGLDNFTFYSGRVGLGGASLYKQLNIGNSDNTSWITSGGPNTHLTLSSVGVSGCVIIRSGGSNSDPDTTLERLRVDPAGNILAGAVSAAGNAHAFSTGVSGAYAFQMFHTHNTSVYGLNIKYSSCAPNNASAPFLTCSDSNAVRTMIASNGNIVNQNNSYGAISDIKLKTNVEEARSYLCDLLKIRVKKYNLKGDPDGSKQLGVIAQEIEQVFPGLVDASDDTDIRESGKYEQKAIESELFDADGNAIITYADDLSRPIMETYLTGEKTKSVKYSVFVPMLITAVQELAARVQELEPRMS